MKRAFDPTETFSKAKHPETTDEKQLLMKRARCAGYARDASALTDDDIDRIEQRALENKARHG